MVVMSTSLSSEFKSRILDQLDLVDFHLYSQGDRLENKRVLFVSEVNDLGYDLGLLSILERLKKDNVKIQNSIGALIIKSSGELYTKSFAQNLLFQFNQMGMAFIGHGVVEITQDYGNFKTWTKTMAMSLEEICIYHCNDLIKRLMTFKIPSGKKVLALHSSERRTSNTLGLWHLVEKNLSILGVDSQEIYIRNGEVVDCIGCPFETCINFGKVDSCYYHDLMVEEVLPAVKVSDVVVWVCPNYNDSISANLLAVINRLTVLYRQMSFHEKAFYAVVVSGNSGSDALAKQLIGALNINKGFYLPPNFVIMATANAPLKVLSLEGIEERAFEMAKGIKKYLLSEG